MNINTPVALIYAAGLLHLCVLAASALTPRVLNWKTELSHLGALCRQVIWTHGIFVVLTITGFGLMSLFCAPELATGGRLARAFCGFVGLFWLGRLFIQFFVFDATPFLTSNWLRAGYHALTAAFSFFVLVYGWLALGQPGLPVTNLALALRVAAATQLCIAVLNLCLPRLLNWRDDVDRMPLLLREVFHVHMWFISITLCIFAVLTWRFATDLQAGTLMLGPWLTGGIALFWLVRFVIQFAYYSSSHWKGRMNRTMIHVGLLLVYGSLVWVYALATLRS